MSSKDFLKSISIALKEARETLYWLMVIKNSGLISGKIIDSQISECDQLVSILVSSVKTIKRNS